MLLFFDSDNKKLFRVRHILAQYLDIKEKQNLRAEYLLKKLTAQKFDIKD